MSYAEINELIQKQAREIQDLINEENRKEEIKSKDFGVLYGKVLSESTKLKEYPRLDRLLQDNKHNKHVKGMLEILLELSEEKKYDPYFEVWHEALLAAVCAYAQNKKSLMDLNGKEAEVKYTDGFRDGEQSAQRKYKSEIKSLRKQVNELEQKTDKR